MLSACKRLSSDGPCSSVHYDQVFQTSDDVINKAQSEDMSDTTDIDQSVTDSKNTNDEGTSFKTRSKTRPVVTIQSTSGKPQPSELEKSLRKLNINEFSALDDDDDDQLVEFPSNRKSGDVTSYRYEMTHNPRGRAVIVNNVNFEPNTGMSNRAGSEKDFDEMLELMRMLGFQTEGYSDLTCFQLLRIFQSVSEEDHCAYDCFVFAIMTHGTDGYLYCTDGVLSPNQLIDELRGDRCTTLVGKPKLFFIQACRGQLLDAGVELPIPVGADEPDSGTKSRVVIPMEADILVAYSSTPGYFSWRNVSSGAWFIQALIDVLREHGTAWEINRLLTRVNHQVAYMYKSNSKDPGFDQMKQMPCYTSTLTKELYFKPIQDTKCSV